MNAAQLWTLRVSAENGDPESQYQLGFLYMVGREVPRDYKLASDWYTKSAMQGNGRAQFSLGVMYSQGKGVTRDYGKAKYWLKKASRNGNADAESLIKILTD